MAERNDSANSSVQHQHGSADHEVTIDIPDNEDYWKPEPECCIYRVPIDLRTIKVEAYTPQVISIGPFHYGNKELIDMEKQKRRYIDICSERIGKEKWDEMKGYIVSQEKNIRNCYDQYSSKYSSKSNLLSSCQLDDRKEFLKMILYDAVFIIELFLRYYWEVDDFLPEKPRYRNTIKRDLQLLENQLPYFILNKLYKLAIKGFGTYNKGSSYKDPSFLDISCKFFDHDTRRVDGFQSSIDVKHFTDLRRYFLMENHPTSKKQGKVEDLPCATKLQESGVRFRRKVENGDCLLHLKFKRGLVLVPFSKKYELKIPRIKVNDWTEPLIRNVMALEQCHYPKDTHVCNYIAFMDFLINTEKDADLLIEKGIIVNCLGESKAITRMFNGFCLQTSTSSSCYYDMAEDLKGYYESWYHNAKATLKSVYFSNPWKGTGTVVGIIILLLTAVNTLYSILHFMKTK